MPTLDKTAADASPDEILEHLEELRELDPDAYHQTLIELEQATASMRTPGEDKFSMYKPVSPVVEEFHKSKSKNKALIGGNRSSKTTAARIEDIIISTGELPDYLKGIYPRTRLKTGATMVRACGVDFDNGIKKILGPAFRMWLPPGALLEDCSTSIHNPHFKLKNGSIIELMSYRQPVDKFGGTARDQISHDEIPPPDVVSENEMRLTDRNGNMIYSFTPVQYVKDDKSGQTTSNAIAIAAFFNKTFLNARRVVDRAGDKWNPLKADNDIEIFHAHALDNPHVSHKRLLETMKTMSDTDKLTRLEGKFAHLVGLIYGREFSQEKNVAQFFKFSNDWPVFCAIDPHPKVDNHITYLCVDPYNRKFVFEELAVPGTVKDTAEAMKALEMSLGMYVVWRIIDPLAHAPDPITGTTMAEEFASHGIETRGGSKDVLTGIYKVRSGFQDEQLFFTPNCVGHIWEISQYIWKNDKPLKENDHYMENLRRLMMEVLWYQSVEVMRREESRDLETALI